VKKKRGGKNDQTRLLGSRGLHVGGYLGAAKAWRWTKGRERREKAREGNSHA